MAKIPVFVVHGFLESGKTQFAMETLSDEYFSDGERNLVIACEEGIEEYEDEVLQKSNTTLVMLEDKSEFNEMFLAECQKKYKPTQVIVEYNCMWGLDYLREMYMPKGWFVAQVITTVDATTFDVYLKNMKSLFMEMAKDSDLIIFNRSTEDTPAATYKRNMRAVNPKAQVVFEKEDGSQLEFEEELPFDINADVIEISDVDYGIWYIDAMDHPEKYAGKTLQEYIDLAGREVLGTNCRRFDEFPVLIKFIDAKDNLSIQVHPDNAYALKNEHQYGKTEMWYVVDCEEGAYLYYGFNREVSK